MDGKFQACSSEEPNLITCRVSSSLMEPFFGMKPVSIISRPSYTIFVAPGVFENYNDNSFWQLSGWLTL
jgi:hypothetical protein